MKTGVFCAVLFFARAALFANSIFVGLWSVDDGARYYRFYADGTGGVSETPEGKFIEEFSFLSWNGTGQTPGYPRSNTLLLAVGPGASPQDITAWLYSYAGDGDTVRAEDGAGNELILTRIAGSPAPLRVRPHPLLGQWEARWNGGNHDGALGTWSFLYRPDGTVRAYHHGLHQFDNAYLVRGKVLFIVGEWRFHPAFPVNAAEITVKDGDSVFVREAGGTTWDYRKKAAALWKEKREDDS
jgi:hypothetical protein